MLKSKLPRRFTKCRSRTGHNQSRLEMLEPRTLLSAVTTHALGTAGSFGITHDDAGNIWVAGGDGLYKVGENGQQIGATAATGYTPFDVVFDHVNQHLYFSDMNNEAIVEVGLDGTVLHQYTVPNLNSEDPQALAVATDGSVWFTTAGESFSDTSYSAEVGRLDLSGNFTFAQASPTGGLSPFFIAASGDGSVWFGASGFGGGPDGNTLLAGASIGHAHADSTGAITVDSLSAISTPASLVQQITVASDNSVWFGVSNRGAGGAGDGPNRLVHGVLSGSTLVQTEYVIPGSVDGVQANAASIALDNAGRLWFTDTTNDHLSFMNTTTGEFTELALPSTIASPLILNITATDVWATANSNGDDLIQLNLATYAAPVVSSSPDIAATAGTAYTGNLATFATADNGPMNYTIDYGNGQTGSGSIAMNDSGVYSIAANVTYAAVGQYSTTLTITTADGDVITRQGTAVASSGTTATPLAGAGINLSRAQNAALAANRTINGVPKLAVATFTGPAATYSASIAWGDATSSAGQIVDLGGGSYAVIAAGKTYATNGTFAGSVVITGGSNVLTLTFSAAISDTPLVVSKGVVLKPLLGRIVLSTVATFSDDINSTASWFTATINWGDGTTSGGLIVRDPFSPGTYVVIGLHIYAKKGTYTVLTLIDNTQENVTATATASIKVN